jgi:hypothetical protein
MDLKLNPGICCSQVVEKEWSSMKAFPNRQLAWALFCLLALGAAQTQGKDVTDTYTWAPIALGAGGWVDNSHLYDIGSFALGAGSGQPGDAPYTIYYEERDSIDTYVNPPRDQSQGIFRSTNAGASWDRIARRFPFGIFDPGYGSYMSASWDTYGLVGMTRAGQGFVYGKLKAN